MAEIGSLVVDLTLKSAEFINNLNKVAGAVAQNSAQMQKSMTRVERAVLSVNRAFEAWLTVRTIRQIERLVQTSLEFAATLQGPLGDSARTFTSQFEELQNHFEAGLAIGFLDEAQKGFLTTEKTIKAVDDASVAIGKTLGFLFQQLSQFALSDVPQMITSISNLGNTILTAAQSQSSWLTWIDKLNDGLAAAINKALELVGITARVPTVAQAQSTLVTPDVSSASDAATSSVSKQANAFQTLADATLRARMETVEFWNATIGTTAAGETMLGQNQALIDFIDSSGTPLEQFRLAIERIKASQLDSAHAARAIALEQAGLVQSYLDAASQATGALAAAFKENKAIQIANAVVNTAAGIVKALGDPKLPFPLDFAVAGSIAAAGAAQIATILAAQPGGASKPSAALKGGGGGVSSAASSSSNTRPGPTQTVTINVVGEVFGPEHFRKIVAGINGVQRDGTALLQVA